MEVTSYVIVKQPFLLMNLKLKAPNLLMGEKFPGKILLALKFNPTLCHYYDHLFLCNKISLK